MEIELKNPEMDKNFSIHFYNATEKEMEKIKRFFFQDIIHKNTFLQGFSIKDGWAMIEFWTDKQDFIIDYALRVEKYFNIKLM